MAKRRGRGEGSIFLARGRWWCQRSVIGPDGKRRRVSISDVSKAELLRRVKTWDPSKPEGLTPATTTAEWFARWEASISGQVRPSTHARYAQLVDWITRDLCAGWVLSKWTPADVQVFHDRVRAESTSWTARMVGRVFRQGLDAAVALGVLASNPAAKVKLPRPEKREPCFLTIDEVRRLLAATPSRYRGIVALAAGCGLRQGEIFAMEWCDIDGGRVNVSSTLRWTGAKYRRNPVKSTAGRRVVFAPAWVVDALPRGGPEGFLFASRTGTPMRPSNFLRRIFRPAVRRAGLSPRLRFHDLRHSFASILLSAGASLRAVAAAMGHVSPEVTLRTYAHCLPSDAAKLAETMGDLYGGAK